MREYITEQEIIALIKKESEFNPLARSHKNAIGIMQVLLNTARQYKKDITENELFELEKNIEIGIKHLDYLAGQYKDKKEILQRYYWGNKKQLTYYYYWGIIRYANKIK